jgi:hypothetical protein
MRLWERLMSWRRRRRERRLERLVEQERAIEELNEAYGPVMGVPLGIREPDDLPKDP